MADGSKDSSVTRLLVVNADDFGYCDQRNRGIVESFQDGIVSSASLLVNSVRASDAVQLAKKHGISLGLHLNLTEGHPIKTHYSSLTSENGLLRGKMGFREALKSGKIDLDEIKQEVRAQLQWFFDNVGSSPTHVDGHQHVHVIPQVCDILAVLMENAGINWTRIPVEKNLDECVWFEEQRKSFFKSVEKDAEIAKETFSRHGIRYLGHFIGLGTMGKDMILQTLQQALEKVFMPNQQNAFAGSEPTFCELMVHPGYRSVRGCGGCGEGPDLFACSEDREHELITLTSPLLQDYLMTNNIRLCSFKEL